jgi:hypothetical protein
MRWAPTRKRGGESVFQVKEPKSSDLVGLSIGPSVGESTAA